MQLSYQTFSGYTPGSQRLQVRPAHLEQCARILPLPQQLCNLPRDLLPAELPLGPQHLDPGRALLQQRRAAEHTRGSQSATGPATAEDSPTRLLDFNFIAPLAKGELKNQSACSAQRSPFICICTEGNVGLQLVIVMHKR